jgi:DNA end-binding protein Ku
VRQAAIGNGMAPRVGPCLQPSALLILRLVVLLLALPGLATLLGLVPVVVLLLLATLLALLVLLTLLAFPFWSWPCWFWLFAIGLLLLQLDRQARRLENDNRPTPRMFPARLQEPEVPQSVVPHVQGRIAVPPRSFWKGYLKLSLVTCPVAMMPAVTEGGRLRFHTLNRKTGNRIQRQYVDAETGKRVEDEDQARGYPRGENDHVILEEEELDEVALESTRTIDIQEFVPSDKIAWIWFDRPHFLLPDDTVAEEAFSVIRDAMQSTGTVGIARLVLYRRERAVMLKPCGKGIVLWTLRYGDEVRDERDYFDDLRDAKPDSEALKLVSKLIGARTTEWDPKMVEDPVQDRLLGLIEDKKKGRKPARKSKTKSRAKAAR